MDPVTPVWARLAVIVAVRIRTRWTPKEESAAGFDDDENTEVSGWEKLH